MNCALPCICHSHETCPRPDRGMGIYLILFYSSGSCGHDASCPLLFYLLFGSQIIVYNTTLKFQNLQLILIFYNKLFTVKYTIKILYDKPIIRIYNCQEFKFRILLAVASNLSLHLYCL